ncbi:MULTISPECIES: hypothetical protein [Cellulomonas]|uniref:hypothetical protein n=1 Tax=Cellulomonas TaxID=1707 RepID=UPI0010A8A368|nr:MULTISPECIES: hypothetical protein [Cellulomonas]
MNSMTWGPALDAELAYRRERVREAFSGRPAGGTGVRRARRAAVRRGADRAARRRWVLPGSGAWHVAR